MFKLGKYWKVKENFIIQKSIKGVEFLIYIEDFRKFNELGCFKILDI